METFAAVVEAVKMISWMDWRLILQYTLRGSHDSNTSTCRATSPSRAQRLTLSPPSAHSEVFDVSTCAGFACKLDTVCIANSTCTGPWTWRAASRRRGVARSQVPQQFRHVACHATLCGGERLHKWDNEETPLFCAANFGRRNGACCWRGWPIGEV